MKRQWTGIYAAALVVLAACGGGDETADTPDQTPAEQPEPQTPPTPVSNVQLPDGVTAEMVAAGQQTFNSGICFSCHGLNGTGGPLAPPLNDQTWINVDGEYTSIQEVIRTGVAQPKEFVGVMPPMGGLQLTDQQINELAAYVYSISHGG